jgi:hypothetical protein
MRLRGVLGIQGHHESVTFVNMSLWFKRRAEMGGECPSQGVSLEERSLTLVPHLLGCQC